MIGRSGVHRRRARSAWLLPSLTLLSYLFVATAAWAVNETPKKTNAIIFGPHPSAQRIDMSIKLWLCAENYSVTEYVWGRAGGDASLANLKTIAANGFAVLVILAHGSSDGLTVEDFTTEQAAKDRVAAYKADNA